MPSKSDFAPLSFLSLPLIARDIIYKELLSVNSTKTEKPYPDTCRSSNSFIVIECAAPELDQKKGEFGKEDKRIMLFKVTLWPKRCETVAIPNERMRVWLGHDDPVGKKKKRKTPASKPWFCVVLAEELRNVLAGLAVFQNENGTYRTFGLSARVTMTPTKAEETESKRTTREAKLLDPLLNFRFLKSMKIEGASDDNMRYISEQVCRQKWDNYQVYSTITALIQAGDNCFGLGHHDAASGYYNRAHDYAIHFISNEKQIIIHPADPVAFLFKINLQRARNWIEQDNFEDAIDATQCALSAAEMLSQTNEPSVGPPPLDEHNGISRGRFRQWTCECIRDGAAKFGQRIKAEDIGCAYHYRSITEQAIEGRAIGIGCCVISDAAPKDAPRPLLELDMRTMQRLRIHDSDDEWESDGEG
ncbi:MAG: hypothetical protein Q9228_001897 [Teloschistes exilis]